MNKNSTHLEDYLISINFSLKLQYDIASFVGEILINLDFKESSFLYFEKYNFNLFGLEKGVNEQKVVRAYALYMTFSGVAIFISGFFSSTAALVLIVIFAIFSTVLPFYLVKKYNNQ